MTVPERAGHRVASGTEKEGVSECERKRRCKFGGYQKTRLRSWEARHSNKQMSGPGKGHTLAL